MLVRRAGSDSLGWQLEQFPKAPVGDQEVVFIVEHAEALLHVAERHVEMPPLDVRCACRLFALPGDDQLGFCSDLCCLRGLQPFETAQMPDTEDDDAGDHQLHEDRTDRVDPDLIIPMLQDRLETAGDNDEQRIMRHRMWHDEAVYAVDHAEATHGGMIERIEQRTEAFLRTEHPADIPIHMRVTREKHAVAAIQGERTAGIERDAGKYPLDIAE